MNCPKCKNKLDEKKGKVKIQIPIPENYGIIKYSKLQLELHKDIQELITTKYKDLGADDCMIVFSRVYSVYALSMLQAQGLISQTKQKDENN